MRNNNSHYYIALNVAEKPSVEKSVSLLLYFYYCLSMVTIYTLNKT